MASDLEDALALERSDPRAALRVLARVDRANRDPSRAVLLGSVVSVLVAGAVAFAVTRPAGGLQDVLALLVLALVGFAPPTFLWYRRQNQLYGLGMNTGQLVSRAVRWAPILVVEEIVLLLACFVVVTVPVALALVPITLLLPDPAQAVVAIAAIALGIAVGLADVLPLVLIAPRYGLADVLAGLRLNIAKVTQFSVAVGAGLALGTGAFVYAEWWEALLAAGMAGVLLGLTLERQPRDLSLAYLVELGRIRCDIRLGRLGSARWRIRHLLPRVDRERGAAEGAGWLASHLTTLLAVCLEGRSGQRWWATGTTAQEMGANVSALLFRATRQQARLDWVRSRLDRIAELREVHDLDLRGMAHESAWVHSVRSTVQLTEGAAGTP